jgi:Tol biopolymer transport system component
MTTARIPLRWNAIVLAALVATALLARIALRSRPETAVALRAGPVTRLTSEPGLELDPVLSPDGRTLAYSAGPPGRTRIQLRQLADGHTAALTEGAVTAGERWPQWSPDGKDIVFQANRRGPGNDGDTAPLQLYIVPAIGGVPRLLFESTTPRQALSPSWLPHQRQILFAAEDGIYAIGADDGGTPRLQVWGRELHSPRGSPDGRWIAYVENDGLFTFGEETLGVPTRSRLIVHPSGSKATISLTDGAGLATNPVWTPDSRSVLFIGTRAGRRDIFRLRVSELGATGDDPDRFTSGTDAHTMSLSADGSRLVYSSYTPGANIWSVPIPSSGVATMAEATQLSFGKEKVEKLAISPDGRWLAFDSDREGQADVWKIPAAGGPAERITHGPDSEFVNDWSPDGRELVVHAQRKGQRDVLVVSADGTRTEEVAATALQEQHAAWGPDGNSIVFDAPPKAGERDQAFVSTRAGPGKPWGPPRQITRNGSSDPRWSPDGRLIAICVDNQLRVLSPDGSGERVVVNGQDGADRFEPSYAIWSRDSRTIFYKVYDRAHQSAIWSVGLEGSAPRLLIRFNDPARRSLRREFATDGTRLYFTIARDESDIWLMELNGRR